MSAENAATHWLETLGPAGPKALNMMQVDLAQTPMSGPNARCGIGAPTCVTTQGIEMIARTTCFWVAAAYKPDSIPNIYPENRQVINYVDFLINKCPK